MAQDWEEVFTSPDSDILAMHLCNDSLQRSDDDSAQGASKHPTNDSPVTVFVLDSNYNLFKLSEVELRELDKCDGRRRFQRIPGSTRKLVHIESLKTMVSS